MPVFRRPLFLRAPYPQTALFAMPSPITAAATIAQTGQTISAAGSVALDAAMSQAQAGQTVSANGGNTANAALSASQAQQSLSAAAVVSVSAALSLAQAGQSVSAGGAVLIAALVSRVQAGNTLVATIASGAVGTLAASQAGQTSSAAASVIVAGALAKAQAAQTIGASGSGPSVNWDLSYGAGYTDVSPKQIVRASSGIRYDIVAECDAYPYQSGDRLIIKRSTAGGVPVGSTEFIQSGITDVATVAAAIDGSDKIHVLWVNRGGDLNYRVWLTSNDAWEAATATITTGLPTNTGQGDQQCALALDSNGAPHVVYLKSDGTRRRMEYRNRVGGTWSSAETVDDQSFAANEQIWHPNIAFDAAGRRVFAWLKGTFNDSADGTIFTRVRQTNGTWGATVNVSGAGQALTSIDQSTSLLVTANDRLHTTWIHAWTGGDTSRTTVSDAFARPAASSWGMADIGGDWTLSGGNVAADYPLTGSAGQMISAAENASRRATLPLTSIRDATVLVRIATDKTATGNGQYLYVQMRRQSSTNEYTFKVRITSAQAVAIDINKNVSSVETAISGIAETTVAGLTHTAGAAYWIRAELYGASPTTLRMRLWADGTAEPSTWLLSGTDSESSLQQAGQVSLRTYIPSNATNAPITAAWDHLLVTPPSPVIPSAIASDAFARTASSWGTADTGGAWTESTSAFSTDGTAGVITHATANTDRRATLNSVSATDVDVTMQVRTDKIAAGASINVYAIARHNSSTNDRYLGQVIFTTSQTVQLQVMKRISSVESQVGSAFVTLPDMPHVADGITNIRFQAAGTSPTTLKLKAWANGWKEPYDWPVSVTDSSAELQTSGAVGVRSFVGSAASNAPIAITVDNFFVSAPYAGPTAPAHIGTRYHKAVNWHFGAWYNTAHAPGAYYYPGIDQDLDHMAQAGITWARISINRGTQSENSNENGFYRGLLDRMAARGIRPLALIQIPNATTTTASSGEIATFNAWVGAIAGWYSADIKHWEIGNEPNLGAFFNINNALPNTDPDYIQSVQWYLSYLSNAYATIKTIDPDATVMTAGIAQLYSEKWLDVALAQSPNPGTYCDAIAFHPYSDNAANGTINWVQRLRAKLSPIAATTNKPIWITEVGFTSDVNEYPGNTGGSEANKAAYMTDMLQKMLDWGVQAPLFYYNYSQDASTGSVGYELEYTDRSAALGSNSTYRTAYYALQALWLPTAEKYIRYAYSDDNGVSWMRNDPGGAAQATHNPSLGPDGQGGLRIYGHGTPDESNHGDNLYYFAGAGGAGVWGSWTQIVTGTHYDSSVNTRWSQYFHFVPGTVDIAYWDDRYPNVLHIGAEIVVAEAIFVVAATQAGQALSSAGSVELIGVASAAAANQALASAGAIALTGTVSMAQVGQTAAATATIISFASVTVGQAGQSMVAAGVATTIGAASIGQTAQSMGALGSVLAQAAATLAQAAQTIDSSAGSAATIGDAALMQAAQVIIASGVLEVAAAAELLIAQQLISAAASVTVQAVAGMTQAGNAMSATGGGSIGGPQPIYDVIARLRIALRAALGNDAYWVQAPNQALPVVIFQSQDGGGTQIDYVGDIVWEGDVVIRSLAATPAAAEMRLLTAIQDIAALTIPGATVAIRPRRPVVVPPVDGVWTAAYRYTIRVEEE